MSVTTVDFFMHVVERALGAQKSWPPKTVVISDYLNRLWQLRARPLYNDAMTIERLKVSIII